MNNEPCGYCGAIMVMPGCDIGDGVVICRPCDSARDMIHKQGFTDCPPAIIALFATVRKENDILRGIAAKVMPCHYCRATELARCPHGFPGCALADDMMVADDTNYVELRQRLARLTRYAKAERVWHGAVKVSPLDAYYAAENELGAAWADLRPVDFGEPDVHAETHS